jgi:hypothetical protein
MDDDRIRQLAEMTYDEIEEILAELNTDLKPEELLAAARYLREAGAAAEEALDELSSDDESRAAA